MAFPPVGDRPRVQIGFSQLGNRAYSKTNFIKPRPVDTGDPGSPDFTITSVSGALIGKIRTDVLFSTLQSFKFTNLNGIDCADFELKLNKLPLFPIEPFGLMTIRISPRTKPVYTGLINSTPEHGTQRNTFVFKGFGLKLYTKEISVIENQDVIGQPGDDIGVVFRDIARDSVAPFAPIIFNPAEININTGVILTNALQLGKYKIDKVFDTLASMAGQIWGVDGERRIFFKPAPKADDLPKKTFFIGYNLQSFKPKLNIQDIRNTIVIMRQEGKSEGGSGWKVGGTYTDFTSIAKFRKKQLDFQVPGFFVGPPSPGNEIDIIGNALLAEKKDPKFSGTFDGLKLESGLDFLENGLYRFVMDFKNYNLLLSEADDIAGWSSSPSIDISIDTSILTSGAGSLRAEITNPALFDNFRLSSNFFLPKQKEFTKITKIRIFVRSTKSGVFLDLDIGIGLGLRAKIDFIIKNKFFKFEWDLSSANATQVFFIHFKVIDPVAANGAVVHIDKIEIEVTGHKFYKMPLTKTTYEFFSGRSSIRGELGVLPPKMETYLASLFATTSEMKYTQETFDEP